MIRIFLTNLGRYNEGDLVGEWLTLPLSADELKEALKRIGIGPDYEEYFITDWETDLEGMYIDEYERLSYLNDIAEQVDGLEPYELPALQAFLLDGHGIQEAIDETRRGNYTIYSDCQSMEDVAHQIIEDGGILNGLPEFVTRYFDYEAYGRDLELEGRFYFIGSDCVEIY